MPDAAEPLHSRLQQIWHQEIPLSKDMAIEVLSCNEPELHVCAALAPNVNVHGTAFAGSLYAIAALCGWGATWLALQRAGRPASIVIANGAIDYRKPVADTIHARCRFPDVDLTGLVPGDKRRFELQVQLGDPSAPPATFRGEYAIRYSP